MSYKFNLVFQDGEEVLFQVNSLALLDFIQVLLNLAVGADEEAKDVLLSPGVLLDSGSQSLLVSYLPINLLSQLLHRSINSSDIVIELRTGYSELQLAGNKNGLIALSIYCIDIIKNTVSHLPREIPLLRNGPLTAYLEYIL